jgi:hypothetical protein
MSREIKGRKIYSNEYDQLQGMISRRALKWSVPLWRQHRDVLLALLKKIEDGGRMAILKQEIIRYDDNLKK